MPACLLEMLMNIKSSFRDTTPPLLPCVQFARVEWRGGGGGGKRSLNAMTNKHWRPLFYGGGEFKQDLELRRGWNGKE